MEDTACYGEAIPNPEIKKLQDRLSKVEQKLSEMEKIVKLRKREKKEAKAHNVGDNGA